MECGSVEIQTREHEWADWQTTSEIPFPQQRTCRRCGAVETSADLNAGQNGRTLSSEYSAVTGAETSDFTNEANSATTDPEMELQLENTPAAPVLSSAVEDEMLQAAAIEGDAHALDVTGTPTLSTEVVTGLDTTQSKPTKRKRSKKTAPLKDASGCEEHNWGEWHYMDDHSCQLVRMCAVCGEQDADIKMATHSLAWQQAQPPQVECLWLLQCQRCGHTETQEERHNLVWGSKQDDPCTLEYKCSHCGFVAETQTTHRWFLTMRSKRGTEHYTCETCHKTMVR